MRVNYQRAREFLERPEILLKEADHCLRRYNQYKEQLRLSADMYWEITGLFAENPLLAPTKRIQEAFEAAVVAREKAIVQVG